PARSITCGMTRPMPANAKNCWIACANGASAANITPAIGARIGGSPEAHLTSPRLGVWPGLAVRWAHKNRAAHGARWAAATKTAQERRSPACIIRQMEKNHEQETGSPKTKTRRLLPRQLQWRHDPHR